MTDASSTGLAVTIHHGIVHVGEKAVNLYGILSYLDEDYPEWFVQNTFNLSETEFAAVLDFADTHFEVAEQIAYRQQDEFNQRLLTALHGTYRLSRKEYALMAVVPVLGSFFLGIGFDSGSTPLPADTYVTLGVGVFCLVLGMLGLYASYKTCYTFDSNAIMYKRIFLAKRVWCIPYESIDALHMKRHQHFRYLHITTKEGQEYDVRCIDTINAVIDALPEQDQFLL